MPSFSGNEAPDYRSISLEGTGVVTSITGTANQVIVGGTAAVPVLSTPQSIGTGSGPTFATVAATSYFSSVGVRVIGGAGYVQFQAPGGGFTGTGTLFLPQIDGAARIIQPNVLGYRLGANFNSTADQSIVLALAKGIIRRIIVTNPSVDFSGGLAVGGVYTAASKGGTVLVANTQTYVALTASTKFLDLTLASGATTDVVTATTIYLSLTTGFGSAATADIYVIGDLLT